MRCVVKEPDWSSLAAVLMSRGEGAAGKEGEAKGFLSGACHRSCTRN